MIIGALVASLVTIVFAPPKLQTGFQDFSGVCTLGSILGLMVERAAAKVNWTPAIFGNGRSANHES
jgi:hypothetical protein